MYRGCRYEGEIGGGRKEAFDLVYLDAANLAVAAAEARLAMCLSLADCRGAVVGDAVGHFCTRGFRRYGMLSLGWVYLNSAIIRSSRYL